MRRSMSMSVGGRRSSGGVSRGGGGGGSGGDFGMDGGGDGEEGDDAHTFAPRLTENTRRLCEIMADEGVRGGSFLERQAEHANKSRKVKEEQQAKYDEECTFHPDTGNAEEVLSNPTSKHLLRLGETPAERVARLALQKQKDAKQILAEENYYKEFTHKPKLNKKAKEMPAKSLQEMVDNTKSAVVGLLQVEFSLPIA